MIAMKETLRELRVNLGWSQKDLSRESGVSTAIVSNAEKGKRLTAVKAKAIADVLSKAYGREIRPLDIEGLNVE